MRTIETELHEMLLDVAPDIHELEEQAMIVAEATAQYREAEAHGLGSRTASAGTPAQAHKSRLLDAVLAAMERIAQADGVTMPRRRSASTVGALELDDDDFSGASLKSLGIRLSGAMGDMAVLDDDDFESMLKGDDEDDDGIWDIEDIYNNDLGRDSLYSAFGKQKKHRSQSLGR
jgi:hypothetical protein